MNTVQNSLEAHLNEMNPIQKVLYFFNNVWSAPYNLDLIDLLMAEDFQITTAGKLISGREQFKEWVSKFLTTVNNSHLETLDIFESACGTKVVTRWKLTGVNNGVLGLTPDKKHVEFSGSAIWLIRDGKLAHNWVERNSYEVYKGLTTLDS